MAFCSADQWSMVSARGGSPSLEWFSIDSLGQVASHAAMTCDAEHPTEYRQYSSIIHQHDTWLVGSNMFYLPEYYQMVD